MQSESSLDLNDFTLLERIGTGTFGEVYKIKENRSGKIFAAKITLKAIEENSTAILRNLKREVGILSKLNHPSILKFIGFSPVNFSNDSKPTIITEFMPNGSLNDILNYERRSLSLPFWNDTRKLINIFGIASAMSYLHLHNIIHRDLKPANILMDYYLCPKISDFGLSKSMHSNEYGMTTSSTDGPKGTPLYIAPEIWEEAQYSPAGDVYAFALIVFEIMTNEEPFKNCTPFQIARKVTSGTRPEIPSDIPDSYRNLIERCWSQEPSERPSFDSILIELKQNKGFITEKVEKEDYFDYVKYIEESEKNFNSKGFMISIDDFINKKSKTFTKLSLDLKSGKATEISEVKSDTKISNPTENFASNPLLQALFGKHGENINYIKLNAERGDVDSLYRYGMLLFNGTGVRCDRKEAARYLKQAADKGHTGAMYDYAVMLHSGEGILINKPEAARYFKLAADNGMTEAMHNYAMMVDKGDGIAINKAEAAKYYKKSADYGNRDDMYNYATMVDSGDGIAINKADAFKYFKKSADLGHIEAMFSCGCSLHDGDGVRADEREAAKYFKQSADLGNVNGMYNYATCLLFGDGVPINKSEAAKYYKMGADNGHLESMNYYGILLSRGEGVPMNKSMAAKYFKMAADQGHSEAIQNYQKMVRNHLV